MPILQYCYLVKVGKMQYDIQIHRTGEERKLWYIDYLIMTGNAYKELKLYNFGQELIKQYEEKYGKQPSSFWSSVQIHHIRPRQYGGALNDFNNLMPVKTESHRAITSWFRNY